ncbi:hypothetical protein LTR36_009319 [Oleoguttula mirabilis]|uniref:Mtf2-like C-terminal domain-containing protein n=1 Tax=Oleoguttula mirabilis TaxID=1507867 RepID=A0AAV9J5P2_9PEZI|nr:hypothetical protein LTR36_009319 [Oleoguttula mirabilis]
MLAKGACAKAVRHCDNALPKALLLPFLYCTTTIQQRTYTKVSRGITSSRSYEEPHTPRPQRRTQRFPPGADSFETTAQHQRNRKEATRNTGWRQFDLGRNTEAAGKGREKDEERAWTSRESSARVSDHVPFEKVEHERAVEVDLEGSTITPSEKKAFEKLFSMKKVAASPTLRQHEKDGEVASKKRKPERELGLDAILDAAVANVTSRERPTPQFPAALRPMAEEARDRQKSSRTTTQADRNEADKETAIKLDLVRVTSLLDKAPTDLALWSSLVKHVLDRLVATGIDPPTTPKQQAAVEAWQQTKLEIEAQTNPSVEASRKRISSDLPVLTANLPIHLLHFMQVTQSTFPSSLLSLNLLPALKKLGPSAFALGATTHLYNAHMRALYAKYGPHSLHAIAETLREMDREVYDFDEETLAIILLAIKDARRFPRGHGGPALQVVWQSEGASRGVKGMLKWRHVVEEKRQEVALRKAREAEAMKDAGLDAGEEDEEEEGRRALASG